MIRMVLFAIGFVIVTVTLVLFQPSSKRAGPETTLPEPVTRAEPTLADPVVSAKPAPIPQLLADPALRPALPSTAAANDSAGMDDQSLRRMTWQTLSNLNHATDRDNAPDQPGSLLHTIVRRSLDETPGGSPAPVQRSTANAPPCSCSPRLALRRPARARPQPMLCKQATA